MTQSALIGSVVAVWRPDSSNLDVLLFDYITSTMVVHFKNGGLYSYSPVARETFVAISGAPSAGKAFDFHVRKAPGGTYVVMNLNLAAEGEAPDDDSLDALKVGVDAAYKELHPTP